MAFEGQGGESDRMQTGVYCWRNKANGKVYVGSAAQSFRVRKNLHLTQLRANTHHCRHFQSAWNKYGEETFDFIVLWRCPPDKCLDWEQWWMDRLCAANGACGYNSSPTAASTLGTKHSAEASGRHAEANKRRSADPEWAAKHAEKVKRVRSTSQSRARSAAAARRMHADPEVGPKIRAAAGRAMEDPEVRIRHKAAIEKAHADPEVRMNYIAAARRRCKLTEEDAKEICRRHRKGRPHHPGNDAELAREFGVSEPTIYNIVSGKHFLTRCADGI